MDMKWPRIKYTCGARIDWRRSGEVLITCLAAEWRGAFLFTRLAPECPGREVANYYLHVWRPNVLGVKWPIIVYTFGARMSWA